MFWRRLGSLVFAVVIAAAPLALELCQIACRAATPAVAEHSCHEHEAAPLAANAPALEAAPHVCGHDDTVPASSLVSAPVLPAATLVQVWLADSLLTPATRADAVALARVPIPPLLFQTPLRL